MCAMSDAVRQAYQQILDSGEPFVKDWPLVRDPLPCICLTIAYLLFVKWIGPSFMKNRKPFELRKLIMLHNLSLILINTWIFYMGGRTTWFDYRKYTECFRHGHNDLFWEAASTYIYYLSKYVDWLDTVFLVLRKKDSNITLLHTYHHASMPIFAWLFFKLAPGGHTTYIGFCNTIIHMIMYTYYFLSSLGPHMKPYLTWKKYLTQLQMLQFASGFLHAFQFLVKPCGQPMILTYILCLNSLFILSLFLNFYIQTYNKNRQPKKSV